MIRNVLLQVAVKNDIKLTDCFVDDNGKYTRHLGHMLEGLDVLSEKSSQTVLNMFRKNVLHQIDFVTEYPHDWRTDKVCCKCLILNGKTFYFVKKQCFVVI